MHGKQVEGGQFASMSQNERDSARTVVLIGFKRQGNLGLGYLAATLEVAGYRVEVIDFEEPPAAILDAVRRSSRCWSASG